jgi:uncharacterized protein YkwD
VLLAVTATAVASEPDPQPRDKRSGCAAKSNFRAPVPKQESALRCLVNRVRSRHHSGKLSAERSLERAAGRKAGDVARCGFSHTACGRPADGRARQTGYLGGAANWQWGENLAKGRNRAGTAKRAIKAWMKSPPHRATLLRGAFEHVGVGLKRKGRVGIWVIQLGCHGC